ncbi:MULTISPECIES: hypothetical protein [unclassified Flavobacterium]|uniref:DUF6934 family protein n=1 Tax=unclassified Flavobacterium TaxID=196869 RepID=UPI001F13B3BC|nr:MULTISPECIES: hypothetical protein [unclassified Flavobacterium]UMY64542.1 hypothetical protein MKO97_08460 [Flavobacterium sp. HJ-32-4]
MRDLSVYSTQQTEEEIKIQYLFASEGKKTIVKAIEYSPVTTMGGRTVYNLGFGDYDEENKTIVDDVNSNNGDIYVVFNTVLSTVPLFFQINPDAVIIVSGSDSHDDFINECLPSCKKKCSTHCRNFQRRIKTYRYYVDKNFKDLCQEYIFFGRIKNQENTFVQYVPDQDYDDILVYKKK